MIIDMFKKKKNYIHEFKTMEEWDAIEADWKAKHPILYILREFYYKLYRLWNHKISMIPKRIFWFFQRGWKGYSDHDIWSFDYYLADVISKGCKHLAKTTNGYPHGSSPEQWNKTLNEIAKEFEDYTKITDSYESSKEFSSEEYNKKLDKMFELLRKNFGSLWD